MAESAGVVSDTARHLAGIFRHLFPGVLVMGAAALAYPDWFRNLDFQNGNHLIVLAILALTVGNTWFALNRYGFHQLVDFLFYLRGVRGPARVKGKPNEYLEDLAIYTRDSLVQDEKDEKRSLRLQEHVKFRASTVLLIFTLGELILLTRYFRAAGSPVATLFQGYEPTQVVIGIALIGLGCLQMAITRRIDFYAAKR